MIKTLPGLNFQKSREIYGDVISKNNRSNCVRVIFQNINGLGTSEEIDKREQVRELINEYKIDITALAEVNINWRYQNLLWSVRYYFWGTS